MKKLFVILMLIILCGCGPLNWVLGVDAEGKDKEGPAPFSFLADFLNNMGPLGILTTGVLTVGGTAYVGVKNGRRVGDAVIAGVQKARDDMKREDSNALRTRLRKFIPNKYHAAIKKVKDAL
ncbi:hypothetical protein IID22_02285 [Patescibacteria group bacterium]|nr:hypothetical protein [Patescibacteria group bacterium]